MLHFCCIEFIFVVVLMVFVVYYYCCLWSLFIVVIVWFFAVVDGCYCCCCVFCCVNTMCLCCMWVIHEIFLFFIHIFVCFYYVCVRTHIFGVQYPLICSIPHTHRSNVGHTSTHPGWRKVEYGGVRWSKSLVTNVQPHPGGTFLK